MPQHRYQSQGPTGARNLGEVKELISSQEFGVLSLFDGVGGLRRAIELLDMPVALFIGVEMCDMRRRVVKSTWPHSTAVRDVCDVDEALVRKWASLYPRIRHLLAGGGLPCRDMSGLRGSHRAEVQGKHSGLVTCHGSSLWCASSGAEFVFGSLPRTWPAVGRMMSSQ